MLYVARTLYMPWGEERRSQVVVVNAGKVVSVTPFEQEYPSMVFVEEVHVTSFDRAIMVSDIKTETHHAGGSLCAYSADEHGVLTCML